MRFSDIARSCTQNLLRRKSRTILTVLGVIVGCCSIVLMISIGQGINEQNEQMLKNMGNLNDITVYADGGGSHSTATSSSVSGADGEQAKLDDDAVQNFRSIAGVAGVLPQLTNLTTSFGIPISLNGSRRRNSHFLACLSPSV